MWSLCAPTATYCPCSEGSEPRRIATTVLAGASTGPSANFTLAVTDLPIDPGRSEASGAPIILSAADEVTTSPNGSFLGVTPASDNPTPLPLSDVSAAGDTRSRAGIANAAAVGKREIDSAAVFAFVPVGWPVAESGAAGTTRRPRTASSLSAPGVSPARPP